MLLESCFCWTKIMTTSDSFFLSYWEWWLPSAMYSARRQLPRFTEWFSFPPDRTFLMRLISRKRRLMIWHYISQTGMIVRIPFMSIIHRVSPFGLSRTWGSIRLRTDGGLGDWSGIRRKPFSHCVSTLLDTFCKRRKFLHCPCQNIISIHHTYPWWRTMKR